MLLGAGEALLSPVKEYHGFFHADKPGLLVIRDQAAYEAFLEQIPLHKIQKRQPAPLSEDPLLKRPAVDWTKVVGIVAFSDSIHTDVTIEQLLLQDDGESVHVRVKRETPPGAEHGARPYGIGQYHFVLIDKRSGEITELTR